MNATRQPITPLGSPLAFHICSRYLQRAKGMKTTSSPKRILKVTKKSVTVEKRKK